jgi:hypothetical protein
MALGPRHDRMMSATLFSRVSATSHANLEDHGFVGTHILAAAILDICAFRPVCLSAPPVSTPKCQLELCRVPRPTEPRAVPALSFSSSNLLITTTGACILAGISLGICVRVQTGHSFGFASSVVEGKLV